MHREVVVLGTEAVLLPRMEIPGPVVFKVLGISPGRQTLEVVVKVRLIVKSSP